MKKTIIRSTFRLLDCWDYKTKDGDIKTRLLLRDVKSGIVFSAILPITIPLRMEPDEVCEATIESTKRVADDKIYFRNTIIHLHPIEE